MVYSNPQPYFLATRSVNFNERWSASPTDCGFVSLSLPLYQFLIYIPQTQTAKYKGAQQLRASG